MAPTQCRSASMPRAMPSSVSGNICGPSASSTICVERVYSHARGGSGFHQIDAAEMLDYALEPHDARLLVHVLDGAARLHELVRAHRRVADEDHLPVGSVLVQDVPASRSARCAGARCRATRGRRRSCGSRSIRGGGTRSSPPRRAPRRRARADPSSRRRRGTAAPSRGCGARARSLRSSQPALRAVPSIVPSMSSSSGTPSRAKRRSRRSATLMLRVLSSTSPSRLRNMRSSHTLTALRLPPPSWPMRTPSGL